MTPPEVDPPEAPAAPPPRGRRQRPGKAGSAAAAGSHPVHLSLQQPDGRHRGVLARHRVVRWLRAALGEMPAQITLRVVDTDEGRTLNRDFRGKDYATDVLTFGYERMPVVVADLVLCAPVVEAEAKRLRLPLEAHYAHLVVHGALHALGHDHEDDIDAAAMQARETEVLRRLGLHDPYASA